MDHIERLVDAAIEGPAKTLLELGTGGGANASYLKRRFTCMLTDISGEMLDVVGLDVVDVDVEDPFAGDARRLRRTQAGLTSSEKGSTLS